MTDIAKKNVRHLRQELIKHLSLDFYEDEEIASILKEIKSYDKRLIQTIFALCVALSGKSSTFVPSTLERIHKASQYLPYKDLKRWLTHSFDLLDAEGPSSFVKFTSKVSEEDLRDFQQPDRLYFEDINVILEAFLRGTSGMEITCEPGEYSYTDTSSVVLPSFVNRFEENRKNYLIFKIAAVHKWAQIARGTLTPDDYVIRMFLGNQKTESPDIASFFKLFSHKELALDIYNVVESIRLDVFLKSELPGLMREAEPLRTELFENRLSLDLLSEKSMFVEGLYQYFLKGKIKGEVPEILLAALEKIKFIKRAVGPGESLKFVSEFFTPVSLLNGEYEIQDISVLLGRIEPEKVSQNVKSKRKTHRKKIEGIITKLIHMPDYEPKVKLAAHDHYDDKHVEPHREYLLIKGKLIEIDDDIREYMREKGGIPGGTLVTGSDAGAAIPLNLNDVAVEEEEEALESKPGGIKYDEWDYRRGGYKRSWCSLYEHDIHPGDEPFVKLTLQRYGGYISTLRKRFELLKREPRLLRRQREGNSIDIDSVIEAFSDIHAGLAPTENLFIRLDRQERNIAVLFLLDMSGSTKGWVNRAEKEALVLMSEALEALGDRYAIYGFSGMTRTKCDFYRIKGYEEPYDENIKKRIAGIQPKDYTRMGPPIRHSIRILDSIEARTKLLITLSDGKPEDWDAYKGEYGIEDTRKALIEAKEHGIHPFCITIDTEASTYLPHMYGETKYICINDVRKLPNRITEIYRMLTT